MKTFIEKLPLTENTSFVARTQRTPHFEVPWHQHVELEMILITEGQGTSYVGNYVGNYSVGDIFFLGSNLPHTFQKSNEEMIASGIVVQFTEDFWGKDFMQLPECRQLKRLFDISLKGLRVKDSSKIKLKPMIEQLEHTSGFQRILQLCNCLMVLTEKNSYEQLSTQDILQFNPKQKERIDAIFQYTIQCFQESFAVSDVAKNVNMSVPAFCSYFKKCTKKTYIDFLNEVRIGHACKQLMDTQMTVAEIAYESGYNTLVNFNKQFLKFKKSTPSAYRKAFMKTAE
jgi:AraC-like DNA-binding protein/quercetin dioxygenase-like cupin family protein